jgi:hypothetical protein
MNARRGSSAFRRHHEDRQEQREPDDHLVRRELLDADRLPQQREDDHDPGERRHHEQDRGRHAQDRERDEDLHRGRDFLRRARFRRLQRELREGDRLRVGRRHRQHHAGGGGGHEKRLTHADLAERR